MNIQNRIGQNNLSRLNFVRSLGGYCFSVAVSWLGSSQPGLTAEQIMVRLDDRPVTVPLNQIERFAKTGQVNPAFAPIAQTLDSSSRQQLRQALVTPVLPLKAADVDRLSGTALFEPLIKNLGRTLQPVSGNAGYFPIRTALRRAASSPDGLSLLGILSGYPDKTVRVDLAYLLQLSSQLSVLSQYRDAAVKAVEQAAQTEQAAMAMPQVDQLPEVQKAGTYGVQRRSLKFNIAKPRLTPAGTVSSYTLPVDLYLPKDAPRPVPLIVLSHGFGARSDAYAYLANHFASHGFAVAAPEHLGSDLDYRQVFLAGKVNDLIQPQEMISRSLDVTYLLDELEKQVSPGGPLAGAIDLTRVGVLGNSLGATTALSVAGAPLNLQRLRVDCNDDRPALSMSFLVQCIAKTASTQPFVNLGDRRIKAVLAAYPLTSTIFGPESLSQITIPTFIIGGSNDVIAPVVQDQIHPFLWLNTPEKYLALIVPGTHFSTSEDAHVRSFPAALVGSGLSTGRSYLQAMGTAFFQRYLTNSADYQPLLTAAYAASIRRNELQLYLTRSLTASQLEQAYGNTPPTPIFPKPVAAK